MGSFSRMVWINITRFDTETDSVLGQDRFSQEVSNFSVLRAF